MNLEEQFKFTKMKIDSFTFTGSNIKRFENGDIQVDQDNYLKDVEVNDIPVGPGKRILHGI